MPFDQRDIRRGMDVYTLDNVYLGVVLAVQPGPVPTPEEQVLPEARQASALPGELLGPMPTAPLGNPGPRNQGAGSDYATRPDGARPIGQGMLTVGRWWGLRGRRTIPLDAVQSVSLERVVLRLAARELDLG